MPARYLKDEEEAVDGMNRTFLKIFEKIKLFKAEASFDFWVKRVTVNTCLDIIRSRKAYKKMFVGIHEFTEYGKPEETDISEDIWKQACEIPSEYLVNPEKLLELLKTLRKSIFL